MDATIGPLAASLARANALLEDTKRAAERTEAAVNDIGSGFNLAPVVTELKLLNEQLRTTKREANETHRAIRDLGGGGGGGALGGLASLFPGGGRATGGALAVGVGAAAVSIAPLLPALGALAVAPAMLFTLAAAAGVAKVAFSGMGAAIDGNRKAYNELNAQQKQFVDVVRNDIYPLLNGLKQTITSTMFAPLTSAMRSVASNRAALANINGIVKELAQFVGQLGASWIRFLGSTGMTRELGQMFAAWLPILQKMTPIFESLFKSFVEFSTAISPLGDFLVNAFGKGAQAVSDWIKQANKTGEFARIIKTIEGSLQLLWRTIQTVANVFGALYQVLAPIGRVVLPDILSALNFIADLLRRNSKLISNDFIGAWKGVVAIIKILSPLIGPLFTAILQAAGDAIQAFDKLANAIGFLKPVMKTVGDFISRYGKYIFEALGGPTALLITAWNKWGDAMKAIAVDVANAFIKAFNFMIRVVEAQINALITGINDALGWAGVNIGKLNYQIPSLGTSSTGKPGGIPSTGGIGPHSTPFGGAADGGPHGGGKAGSLRGYRGAGPIGGPGGSGTYADPVRGGSRQSQRIDMGKDFGGTGPIYSIGPGIVQQATYSYSGWGAGGLGAGRGGYVSVLLTSGSRRGWTFYVAEDIRVLVHPGQPVDSRTILAQQLGEIEMGWAASPTTPAHGLGTLSSSHGTQHHGGDPGSHATPEGQDFANFISGLGSPGGGGAFTPVPLIPTGGAPPWTQTGHRTRRPRVPPAVQQLLGLGGMDAIASAQNAVAAANAKAAAHDTVQNIEAQIKAEQKLIAVLREQLAHLSKLHESGKLRTAQLKEERLLNNEITSALKAREREEKTLEMARLTAKDKALLAPFGSVAGGPSALQSVRATFAGIQAQVRAGTATLNSQMTREMTVIGQILKDKVVPPEIVAILRNRLAQIRTMISAEAQAMQGVASALSSLGSQAMSAFDAINANWQSPAGKQLAQMQKEDQARQLKQALDDAISQYGADSQQAKDAQRAIDEAMLAQQAADQQTAHDQALKAQKDQFEKEYAGLEKQIQRQHLTAEEAAKRLRALYKKYGLTPDSVQAATDWNTAQSLFVQGMSDLVSALNNLYTAITGKAAPESGGGGGDSPGPATKPPGGDFLPNPKMSPLPGSPGWNPGSITPGQPWWPHGGFADGGSITQRYGPGAVPIVAHAGEYVINAKSARRLGDTFLGRLNSYADGGPVDPLKGKLGDPDVIGKGGPRDTAAMRAAGMWIHDAGTDKWDTYVATALMGALGPRAQAEAAIRQTTTTSGIQLTKGMWRAPPPDPKLIALLTAAHPGIVFETGTPGQQISAQQAVSRLPGGWGAVGGLIQASMGLTGRGSPVEQALSGAVHFAKGYLTDARAAIPDPNKQRNNPRFDPPGLAAGGIVKGGRGGLLAWIGEGQHDEMVTPLPAGGGGGHTGQIAEFHIYIDGDKVEKTVTKRQLRNARYGNPGIAPATR